MMREPLFSQLRYARACRDVPTEIQHSPILKLQWLRANNRSLRLWFVRGPLGVDFIEEICCRALRNCEPVRAYDTWPLRLRVAESIYGDGLALSRYVASNRKDYTSGCFIKGENDIQRLWVDGESSQHYRRPIPIHKAPTKPCRWCGTPVMFKDSWVRFDGTVRCNNRLCREIDWFERLPQSRGGIALTPKQRHSVGRDFWPLLIMNNYLVKTAKAARNGR